ncbi:MAG: response regulator transcription factor [Brevinematales bacterium]|nr:response regulator transcription factor [Brevinematales bacterium]
MENKVLLILPEAGEFQELLSHLELHQPPIGYQVVKPEMVDVGIASQVDVVLFDVAQIGNRSGTLLQELRRRNPALPIMVVSDQVSAEKAVYFFNMGADDFIRKPFDTMEVFCRLKARLRVANYVKEIKNKELKKGHLVMNGPVRIGEAEVDFDRMLVIRNGETIMLTPKEAGMLKLLYMNKGRVIPRAEFLKTVWFLEEEHAITDRVVDTNIVNIREKIGDTGRQARYIKTIFGVGYMLIEV